MILFKYTKTGGAAYISHLDMIRHIGRTLRRAGIDVKQSEGFNKHSRIFLSPPIGVGLQSLSEYCLAETDFDVSGFREAFNNCAPEGVSCIYACYCHINPNISGRVSAAEYELTLSGGLDAACILGQKEIIVTDRKGKEKDVRGRILSLTAEGCTAKAVLSFGNDNLRADVFCEILQRFSGILVKNIVKTKVFDEKMQDIDNVFQKL